MSDVLIIAGPTASGKTALAVELALRFGAEIVSADSRQIYRGMAVGTAQPSAAQRSAVPHHLVGFLHPRERYSAARFVRDAGAAVSAIEARGRRTIVVGGTGFYLRALAGEMPLAEVAHDEALRTRIGEEGRVHPQEALHQWLAAIDRARAATVQRADRYRTLRALEVALARRIERLAGRGAAPAGVATLASGAGRMLKVALSSDRAELARRIRRRAHEMIDTGLLEEAEACEGLDVPAASAVGYPQAMAYLRGMLTRAELEEILVRATLRYAKRQMTWLRSEPALLWIPAGDGAADTVARAARETLGWT